LRFYAFLNKTVLRFYAFLDKTVLRFYAWCSIYTEKV